MSYLSNSNIEVINQNNISSEKTSKVQNLEKDINKKKLEHFIDNNIIKSNMALKQPNEKKIKRKYSVLNIRPKLNINNIENNKKENKVENDKNYLKIIEDLEKRIKEIDDFYTKRISNLNIDMKEKDNYILSLSNSNNILRNSLESLTLRVDKILYNSRNNNNSNNNKLQQSKSTTDMSLEYQLKIKEKEIKNQQKLIKILTTDNKNIKSTIERYNLVDVNINLNDQLHEKDVEISNLQKKLHNSELKLEEHNLCSEKIKTLNEQILAYKKEIELQKVNFKKSNKIYTDLKTKIDKYGISGARLNYIKNKNNKKNSDDILDINIHTLRNNNNNSIYLNNENIENDYEKVLSGNKTDRLEGRKVNIYYNKNNMKLSPIPKNKNENLKNENKINKEGLIILFNSEELLSIKRLLDDNEEKYYNFIKKINIIEKYVSVKEKEMNQNIKIIENKLKKTNELYTEAKNTIKEKEKEITKLNLEIRDLNQIKLLLVQKIKELNIFLSTEKNNNQMLKDENIKIKNSIFNIDGIVGKDLIKEKDITKLKKERNLLNNNELGDNNNKKNEGYRTGAYLKIEEKKIIGKKIYTIQPLINSDI